MDTDEILTIEMRDLVATTRRKCYAASVMVDALIAALCEGTADERTEVLIYAAARAVRKALKAAARAHDVTK